MRLSALIPRRRWATWLAVAAVSLFTAAGFLAQERPAPYRRAATWQETLYTALEGMRDPADPLDGVHTGVWLSSGPYEGNHSLDTVLPPEKSDGSVRWIEHPGWHNMTRREIDASGRSVIYDRCSLYAETARTVDVFFAGSAVVWLNGRELFRGNTGSAQPVPSQIGLPLRKGKNELLIKSLHGGPHPMNPDPRYEFALVRPGEVERRRNAARDRLWARLRADFPDTGSLREMRREQRDQIWSQSWPAGDISALAARYAAAVTGPLSGEARRLAAGARTPADLQAVRSVYNRARNLDEIREALRDVHPEAVNLAVDDLIRTFGARYAKGAEYRRELAELEKPFLAARAVQSDDAALERLGDPVRRYQALSREALLANPMLDFDKILVVRRNFGEAARALVGGRLGMPGGNSWTNDDIPHTGWDNQIAVLSELRGQGRLTSFYQPPKTHIVSDVDLDFDASRVMFSSIGSSDRWHLFEVKADGRGLRQITPDLPDVDHFDSCYLPDGRIAFASTATFQAMPCINGGAPMAQLYTSDNAGKDIRQITFEQDSDWTPAVHENGRLLYLRWEYTDIPHYFSRLLFHANPDGTGQMEYFHSNSYFPNCYFYARSIPGHPSEVVGIISGHHGISRSGRMIVYDPARGRHEADGVVQEIPGRGRKVDALIRDTLIEGVWPQFLHPYPLADYSDPGHAMGGGKYFLAAMKREEDSLWGIYLVDTFDNMVLLKEVEGAALLEPVPFHPVPRPPVIPDRTHPGEKEATVYLSDVYSGPGLAGIPRGKVKSLRLFSYHFNYNHTGGHASVGIQSGWDIKRILGTVPVEEDGSASFKIPASTPISVQPLDEKGRALQLMRSWFTGMPGEVVSCVGCHDRQNSTPLTRANLASRRPPSAIKPWYGPPRPFAFRTEVQPVLDRYCAGCHNGRVTPDFTANPKSVFFTDDTSYIALQSYVHRYGPENDYHLQRPMEYHTSTSPLFQILDRGHHGVKLDSEAYDRLVTWADLNTPWRGSWGVNGVPGQVPRFRDKDQVARRIELSRLYAGVDTDPESEFARLLEESARRGKPAPIVPRPADPPKTSLSAIAGWPFDAAAARKLQRSASGAPERSFDLGSGVRLDLVLVPAGSFIMGDPEGPPDSGTPSVVRIDRPFYIGRFEITNRQYQAFDPRHDSRYIDQSSKDHFTPGDPANRPEQPAVRVTWEQALAFCRWLGQKTGERFTLPTEAQWEWASRAGSASPFWFGSAADFGKLANLADSSMKPFRSSYQCEGKNFVFTHLPFDEQVNDGSMVSADVGRYYPNPWGLFDMHGNVAEWTLSTFKPYPYDNRDGLNEPGPKVVRGGSWRDHPRRATSAHRIAYEPYQPVWDVGFRVVMEAGGRAARQASVD
ncbi:MAG: SUMF1/EgtB/PvdO family nonheme iron enzyme [Bryobacterales bacterium]|nr:SUMF1/EgtB/PvdO family nonheme iron enzyme [Bryobacterales bacterium]